MNLKKKLSIIVLLCFTLNMLLLFGYYELVLYDKIEESLNTMQIELRNDVNYISSQIKRLQGTDNIKDWINNIDNIDSINISIERGDNTLLYEYKTYEKSLLNVTFTDLINIKDNVYMIKVERPLQISKIRNIPFIKDIVVAEVVIGVFILIFILLHIFLISFSEHRTTFENESNISLHTSKFDVINGMPKVASSHAITP